MMPLSDAITRRIEVDFDPKDQRQVAELLQRYGAEERHREVDRVHAAILELAKGDADKIEDLVGAACSDYRDVLYWLTFDEEGNPPQRPTINTDTTPKLPPNIPKRLLAATVKLEMLQGAMQAEQMIAENPTDEEIARLVHGMAWDEISFVIVKLDEANWLDGSGSLKPADGLSAMCEIEGQQFVTVEAPQSLDEIVALLQSFNRKDGNWRTMVKWS